jgi:hypothetical protein
MPLKHRNRISTRLTEAFGRVLLACLMFLLVGFAAVPAAQAHAQPDVLSQAEAIAPAAAGDACCHDVDGGAQGVACTASICCPALASIAIASSVVRDRRPGGISRAYDTLAGSLSVPPLLHPPISA